LIKKAIISLNIIFAVPSDIGNKCKNLSTDLLSSS